MSVARKPTTLLDYNMDSAIVLGAEGKGVHDLVRKSAISWCPSRCWEKFRRLNVSVAAGVVLYEIVRQRRKKQRRNRHEVVCVLWVVCAAGATSCFFP